MLLHYHVKLNVRKLLWHLHCGSLAENVLTRDLTRQTATAILHKSNLLLLLLIYSVRQKKVSPKVFFAIFSATARNFYMKFHKIN